MYSLYDTVLVYVVILLIQMSPTEAESSLRILVSRTELSLCLVKHGKDQAGKD